MAVCCLVWLMNVSVEIARTGKFVRSILFLVGSHTEVAVNDELRLLSISKARAAFILIVQACRFAVAVSLMLAGTLYLLSTVSIPNLLMNNVALVFVLHIDECIYQALTLTLSLSSLALI